MMAKRVTRKLSAIVVLIMMMLWTAPATMAAVSSHTVTEGDSGFQSIQVRVDGPFAEMTWVDYELTDGTATYADGDFALSAGGTSGRLFCPIGDGCVAMWIYVDIFGDTNVEPDEEFYIDVDGIGRGTITILNDDGGSPLDTDPPVLSLPDSLEVEATSPDGAIVTFTATATDADPENPIVSCTPSSGSLFEIGMTTVECSATDTAGNVGRGSFKITVQTTLTPAEKDVCKDGGWTTFNKPFFKNQGQCVRYIETGQ